MSGSGISWARCVCTSLQTDNHASTSPLCFYRPDALPAAQPQRQSIEGIVTDAYQIINIKSSQNDVQYKAAKPKTISRDEAIFPVFCAEV